jgi:hypothetical protein
MMFVFPHRGLLLVGFHFGTLIIWTAISCVTLTAFQYLGRRREVAEVKRNQDEKVISVDS